MSQQEDQDCCMCDGPARWEIKGILNANTKNVYCMTHSDVAMKVLETLNLDGFFTEREL